jgi:hypothetical protein
MVTKNEVMSVKLGFGKDRSVPERDIQLVHVTRHRQLVGSRGRRYFSACMSNWCSRGGGEKGREGGR